MEDNIFDIAIEEEGTRYTGWVNPSEKLSESGRPVSFHVVLNGTSFGYLSYNNCKWNVNEERPDNLVIKLGEEIEKHFSMDKEYKNKEAMHGGITGKRDKNAGSGTFNRGTEQDPDMNDGVADGTSNPGTVSKEKENPKSGNIGKNNAGGYEHLKK